MTIDKLLEDDQQEKPDSSGIDTVSTGGPQGLSEVHKGYRRAEHGEKPSSKHTPAAFYVTDSGTAFLKRNNASLNGELDDIKERADLAEDHFGIEIAGEIVQGVSNGEDEYTALELDNSLVQSDVSVRYDAENGFQYDQGPEVGEAV